MKQLFTETMARYYPNVAERSVDVEMQTIEAGYDPELRVARLIVTAGGTTYHTTPVHASGQVSAVRQMLAAYDNELREIGGYATFDAAEARLKAATAAKEREIQAVGADPVRAWERLDGLVQRKGA